MSIRNGRFGVMLAALLAISLGSATSYAASGLTPGPVELQSLGPMTFATSGVLIIGDPKAAAVYAIATEDKQVDGDLQNSLPKDLRGQLAAAIGAEADALEIGDMAVNPETGNVTFSVKANNRCGLVRMSRDGQFQKINLDKIDHGRKQLPNPPADKITGEGRRKRNLRDQSITDVAYFDGKVIVSGLSAGDSPSAVVEFPFPFADNTIVSNVEIFHAAHGRVEDAAIQTFVPLNIDGEPSLLAGFTCTPLVNFPIGKLDGGEKVRGKTVAELGNRNRPIDMIVYEKEGVTHLLLSNTARGVMKVSTEKIDDGPGLTEPVRGGGTAGQPFEKIESLVDVTQMDKLSETHGIALIGKPGDTQRLQIFELP
ncbi:hypothetical protein [Rosistilla oblonga]|uniref:hypothetical protein n=1 Tax=Rosistilla oblonga TaxID=2527990 RepID=UPI003A97CF09